MNVLLWILQWALAAFLLLSFLSMPYLLRRGAARNNVTAALMACLGLACGIALVLPWWTGEAKVLTPVAASLIALTSLWDGLTNRMPPGDAAYLVLVTVMGIAIALGRFHAFGEWQGSFLSWAVVAVGTGLLVLCLLASPAGPTKARWVQAAAGICGILGGALGMLQP
ncbi:hypothetical protein [Actinomadura sp. WMMB 499]|uniref:hypothetical protein n=1 Tax=Actinomadura sp. WMMB 499 TaxID=1219491 RepID=UPI001246BE1E|nr:hypothetical protein [Actinomadura sp. WMMB 499]QFG21527.1 hypothetical protein F7P10_10670 [Actinomadura sp. WMMB 499]